MQFTTPCLLPCFVVCLFFTSYTCAEYTSNGEFVFTAQEKGGDPKRTTETRHDSFTLSYDENDKSVAVTYTFPWEMQGRVCGLISYKMHASGQTLTEWLHYEGGPRTWHHKGEYARRRLELCFQNDPFVHKNLFAFEAVQRMALPAGLLSTVLAHALDRSKIEMCRRKETPSEEIGHNVTIKTCAFHVPNDSAKRYTNETLDKMFTRWQSVLGSDHHTAVHTEHVAYYKTPVTQVLVRILEQPDRGTHRDRDIILEVKLLGDVGGRDTLVMGFERTQNRNH